ncbi:MAG: LapA family protein [Methylophilaceae bacterium]|nr:LapA family protein [Methylophilaceae bacterium]
MRYVYTALGLLLFIFLLGLALKNASPAVMHYYLGISWRAPLSLMLLLTFFSGAITGIIACLTSLVRQRRQILALQRELKILSNENHA